MAKSNSGLAKKFGPRYGRTTKEKYARLAEAQNSSYKCPYCNYVRVERQAVGIWKCKTCDTKFTSKAYSISKAKSNI